MSVNDVRLSSSAGSVPVNPKPVKFLADDTESTFDRVDNLIFLGFYSLNQKCNKFIKKKKI